MQRELTELSTQGKRVIAQEAGHGIPYVQPGIIVNAVAEMVKATRS